VALRRKSNDGGDALTFSTDAWALRRGDEGGVGELRCRAQLRNEREQQRASTAFDQKEKGKRGRVQRGRRNVEEVWRRGVRSSGRACGRWGQVMVCSAWWPRLGHWHGPAQAHSADFDLNKDF
jgi:hypothetical protein